MEVIRPTPPEEQVLIPAATLVIFRHGGGGGPPELLMVQRAREMRFAGGMAVFPGGRVDPADFALAESLGAGSHVLEDTASRIAAIRETLEETGLVVGIDRAVSADEASAARAMLAAEAALGPVLERFGWRLTLDRLVPFAHWCQTVARAFDTRFYLADLGSGQVELTADEVESSHLFWVSAADALAMDRRGEIGLIFPTARNLERLALFGDFSEAVENAEATPMRVIRSYTEERDGEMHLCIPEDVGYPVTAQPLAQVLRGLPKAPN